MPTRPLASDIGATETALRALLVKVLGETPIDGYRQWVFLNVREAYSDDGYGSRVAEILHEGPEVVAAVEAELASAGLLDRAGALSAGVDPELIDAAQSLLNTVRERAEALLR